MMTQLAFSSLLGNLDMGEMSDPIRAMIVIAVVWFIAWLITFAMSLPAKGQTIVYAIAGLFSVVVVLRFLGVF